MSLERAHEHEARLALLQAKTRLARMPSRVYRIRLATKAGRPELMAVLVGDLNPTIENIIPLIPEVLDLQVIRDLWVGMRDDVPDLPQDSVFFPPLLDHRVLLGVDVFMLGSMGHNIHPHAADMTNFRDLLAAALEHGDFIVSAAIPFMQDASAPDSAKHPFQLDLEARCREHVLARGPKQA